MRPYHAAAHTNLEELNSNFPVPGETIKDVLCVFFPVTNNINPLLKHSGQYTQILFDVKNALHFAHTVQY